LIKLREKLLKKLKKFSKNKKTKKPMTLRVAPCGLARPQKLIVLCIVAPNDGKSERERIEEARETNSRVSLEKLWLVFQEDYCPTTNSADDGAL
jgi:hypothetical protein